MKRIPIEIPEGVELPEPSKVMSFTQWLSRDVPGLRNVEFVNLPADSINRNVEQYTAYLRDNPEKPSVIETCASLRNKAFYKFSRLHLSHTESVKYIGRCREGGDLFAIYADTGEIALCQGTLNGLFIEIPQ